ncbi:MAG: class I SAM-dependent methyltransferase [Acidobacteriota bacterium]
MFAPVERCWICDGATLRRYHQDGFDFHAYATQDPELHAYTGQKVWLVRCAGCGHGQPEALPTLPRFFDRMYDQEWDEGWVEDEFAGRSKDFIFHRVLRGLERRHPATPRRLLDVGAHAGRFMSLAQQDGWTVEGIELNARTAACAARRTGAPVHQVNVHALNAGGRRYDAVTLTDVLEHVPEPLPVLKAIAGILDPGGSIAVKVPHGPIQALKERGLAAVTSHRVSLAENLVHVNHFSVKSLRLALERAGFGRVAVGTGAPELLPVASHGMRAVLADIVRLSVYAVAALPGGVHSPLAFNLQAFATKRPEPGR